MLVAVDQGWRDWMTNIPEKGQFLICEHVVAPAPRKYCRAHEQFSFFFLIVGHNGNEGTFLPATITVS